jgi:PAS domain S-box-containing protein
MGVWHLDLIENKRHFDDQVCHLLGIAPAKFTGTEEEFYEAIHPDDREMLKAVWARTIELGGHYEAEYRAVWPDGSVHYLTARGKMVQDDKGRPVRVNGLIWDITDRKQMEKELQESENRLRRFYESGLLGVIYWNMNGEVTDANDRFLEMVGYDRDDLAAGRIDWNRMTPPEYRHLDEYSIAELKAAGVNKEPLEKEYIRKDGLRVPILIAGAMLDEARFNGVAFVLDITERKRAEETLRVSEEHYRSLFDNMLNGYAYCEMHFEQDRPIDFTYLNVNEAFETLTGLRDVVGRRVSDVIPGIRQSDPELFEVYGRVALTGVPERFETYVEALGMWFSISVYSPREEHFVSVFDVITERKRTEEALQLSESRFRLLSGTASRLLASQNPQKIVKELCLQVMEHLDCHAFFNFLVDELAGKLHLNACAGIPDGEARNIEWLDYGVAVCGCVAIEGKRIVAEDIFNTPDIRTELVKSYGIQAYACHPLEVRGKLIGTLSFGTKTRTSFSDEDLALMKTVADQVATAMEKLSLIDELRKSRDELELRVRERTAELHSYMAKLEESNQALQDFASIASHDMQEPLRKVISFGNMLSKGYEDSLGETGNDYLRRMLDATERMQSLLKGLLEYSRVTTKADPFVEVELAKIIGEVLSDLEIKIKRTGAEVRVLELPVVKADPTQMRQLLQNLIGNALKFHKDGEKPVIEVRSALVDGKLQITVEDNGIGFEEQYLERIFAPFQRLHGRNSQYEGTGMGLAICKKIVERHGGSITARSEPGKGSAFIITLPRTENLRKKASK